MKKIHRLLLAGTILSAVVSLQEAKAGVANGDPTKPEGGLAPWHVELAQAAEPEQKPSAAPSKPPAAAPAKPPAAAPAPPQVKPAPPTAPPPAAARPPEHVAPPPAAARPPERTAPSQPPAA